MTNRINFLAKGKYTLTYLNMIIFVAAFSALCILFYSGLFLRHFLLKREAAVLAKAAQELNIRKEKALVLAQVVQAAPTQTESSQALLTILSYPPTWSEVLEKLASNQPKQLRLTGLSSEQVSEETIELRKVSLTGEATSAAAVGRFIKGLRSTPLFQNTLLASTAKAKDKMKFSLSTNVVFREKRY